MKDNPALEVTARDLRQAVQTLGVRGRDRTCRLDFDTPDLAPLCHHAIDFHLIPVPVMPEAEVRLSGSSLGNQLLHDERLQKAAESLALLDPMIRTQVG